MANDNRLYHYTSEEQYALIMKAGFLKLTPSNLLEPVNPHWETNENGIRTLADETDNYKPVVWLTSLETPDINGIGLSNPKAAIRIAVEEKPGIEYFPLWAKKNRIKNSWFKRMFGNSRYGTFYVSEAPIPTSDFIEVCRMNGTTAEVVYSLNSNNIE